MKLTEVIRRPLVTEKTTVMKEDGRTLVFEVARRANKLDVKRAVETLFKVSVTDVNTLITRGKTKRMGRGTAKKPNWKKAIVTLKAGEKIDFFEGV